MDVLLVEDDPKISGFICAGLTEEGYAVEPVPDGLTGLRAGLERRHEVIVLDVMLPGKPGTQVLRELRSARVPTPVLLLTARDTLEDIVQGLDAGADDYLTKPFAFAELLARLRALLRRAPTAAGAPLQCADLVLDPSTRTVTRAGRPVALTNREFTLLEYFLHNPGRVLTRAMIAAHVWGTPRPSDTNVIDVYVNYLRNKLDAGQSVKLLHTIRGAGYILQADARAAAA